MNEVVIVAAARTPVGDLLGSLKSYGPVELAEVAARAALERSGVDPQMVQEVGMGMLYKQGIKAILPVSFR